MKASEDVGDKTIASNNLKEKVFIYNTLKREKVIFKPMEEPKVKFYSCGPTVYDFAHIGNFRAFLTYDTLKRWLRYCGFDVEHVCNLTDIDDKIIAKMKSENMSMKEVTEKYAAAFFEDLDVLNIDRADKYPKATEYVSEIEDMIRGLIDKGFAYEEKGSVYFRVSSFPQYGKLAQMDFSDVIAGAGGFGPNERRGTTDKENERDFALWKAFTEQDGEVSWESSFGKGRPGWHIECSAMAHKLLGPSIDLHAGGVDLVFPHHENEIAQSEAFSGRPFCQCWVHNGFVNINNEKMSKSLRNFKTLRDIATSPSDARAFRFMVVSAQYRAALNFNPDTLKASSQSLKRIDNIVKALKARSESFQIHQPPEESPAESTRQETFDARSLSLSTLSAFESAMCDDMNTPRATAALFGLVNAVEKAMKNKGSLSSPPLLTPEDSGLLLETIERMDRVFGILYEVPQSYFASSASANPLLAVQADFDTPLPPETIPDEIRELITARAAFKAEKKYADADSIRQQLLSRGFNVKDKKGGEADVFLVPKS